MASAASGSGSDGWHRAIPESELPEGALKTVDAEGDSVVIARVNGKLLAMGAICTHAGWDLGLGTLNGPKLTCAGHGAIWDLSTGRADFDEELDPEPLYDVHVADGVIFVRRRG